MQEITTVAVSIILGTTYYSLDLGSPKIVQPGYRNSLPEKWQEKIDNIFMLGSSSG